MSKLNLIILYVDSPAASTAFYERLLGHAPEAAYPNYVSFGLEGGLHLGLWSLTARNFVSGGTGHRSEIAFMVPNDDQVRDLHARWTSMAVDIEQPLHSAVFGLTFVAVDPDGHRIRVCTPD